MHPLPQPLLLIAATPRQKETEIDDTFQRTFLGMYASPINKYRAPST